MTVRYWAALAAALMTSTAFADQVSVTRPETINFDESLAEAQQRLHKHCDSVEVRAIEPVEIPGISTQSQIDCEGFDMAGRKRLAEFVYGDGKLYFVWVLVEPEELDGIEKAMVKEYGSPKYVSTDFSAFTEERTALRKDVPEFLFYAPIASAEFEAWFSQAQ